MEKPREKERLKSFYDNFFAFDVKNMMMMMMISPNIFRRQWMKKEIPQLKSLQEEIFLIF